MSKFLCVLFSLLLLELPLRAEEKITKEDSKEILSYLSSDELGGRGTGQEGNRISARFIAKRFKEYGLEPIHPPVYIQPVPKPPPVDGEGYFQDFTYSYSARVGIFRRRTVTVQTSNVVGIIRGKTDKCILFGAHFDHLGIRGGQIYNGADDNASGTTALLELAEAFAVANDTRAKSQPECTLVFAAFGAEEVGLVGSRFYASNPATPLHKHALMINMDMIGRLKEDSPTLSLYSGNLTKDITSLVRQVEKKYPFDFSFVDAGSRSDHAHFNRKGIPVLFFHTGSHPQYHQPTDDEHLINYDGLVQLTKYIFEFTNRFMGQ